MDLARQAETIRGYSHLGQIPIVLLAPVCSVLRTLWVPCADSGSPGPSSLELYVAVTHWIALANRLSL